MTDYDSPWKESLDQYFEAFILFLFPHIHGGIDWSRGYESLDKEFQQVAREAEQGRRYVDKLVRVWRKDGQEAWVLIHVEVQGRREAEFPLRMYVYNYRAFDRYNVPVVSLAVLADDDPDWRPTAYQQDLWGCTTGIVFPHVKLLDYRPRTAELEASDNPFAKIVLAHLKAAETRGEPVDRQQWKSRIIRGLYERGFSEGDVRELFRLVDWMMELPPVLEERFWQDVVRLQEEKRMPFMTTPERVGLRKGLRAGIKSSLEIKFGPDGLALVPEIEQIHDIALLESVLDAIKTAEKPDDLRRLWASTPS